MSDSTKPGVKTTEFWLAAGSMIVSGVTNLGLVPQNSDMQGSVGMIASVLLCAWIGGQYIGGRNGLKGTEETKREMAELLGVVKEIIVRDRNADAGSAVTEAAESE